MISLVRAGLAAALLMVAPLVVVAANAAEKPFQNSDLADSAVTLEAQIKSDAGTPTKPVAQIRRDADAAFAKNDFRAGMALLGQIVAAAPNDSATWLRLARTIMQIRPADDNEKRALARARLDRRLHRLSAHHQPQRGGRQSCASRQRAGPAPDVAAGARRAAAVARTARSRRRARAIRAAARAARLPRARLHRRCRHRFAARLLPVLRGLAGAHRFLAVRRRWPAPTSRLCRWPRSSFASRACSTARHYTVTLRAGLPSVVHETLSKSADFRIYVRDRKPSVRFSTTAYVLPRTGQRGIPVISVNTRARRGRDLSDQRPQSDRCDRRRRLRARRFPAQPRAATMSSSCAESRGVAVWKGELAVDAAPINTEVTTAFPVDQAVGELKPGVYVMVAQPQELKNLDNNYDSLATQWFIVSDLGLTAFSGNDGIHVFVNSLATHGGQERRRGAARFRAATRCWPRAAPMPAVMCSSKPGWRAGRAALRPRCWPRPTARATMPSSASRRRHSISPTAASAAGRRRTGLDAFVYAERGVYRSGETAYLTALLRDAAGRRSARRAADLRGRAARRRRIPPRAGCGSGPRRPRPDLAAPGLGADRHLARARLHRSEAAGGRRNDVPGRGLCARSDRVRSRPRRPGTSRRSVPAKVDVAGRFLYGAPAADLDLEGEVTIAVAKERTGFAGYQFGLADEEVEAVAAAARRSADDRRRRQGELHRCSLDKLPSSSRPLEAQIAVRMAEPGGRAVERKITLPVTPRAAT